MRADPTQMRLASAREEAYQELHDSQPMPWTAREELQKLQKGQFLDISTDIPEDDEIPWKNTLRGMYKQTLLTYKPRNSSIQGNV